METDRELVLRPIGWVAAGRPSPDAGERWEEAEAEIEIDPAWAGALDGIDEFSHIWVVWWLDQAQDAPSPLRVRPEGRAELPLVGLFSTRSPRRPNPIATTAVRLVERRANRLRVVGLDAYQGTPVLDIKPYIHRGDLIPEATMPAWLEHLWRIHDQEQEK